MIYIGIDLHARRFSMAVLNQDNSIMFEQTRPTSCQNLKAAIGAFGETKSVVFEESTLAAWAYRVLPPWAEKVVVADPRHNHWIARDAKSNDITAARKLTQLLRAGLIHPVHHSTPQRQLFKELVLSYHDTSGEVVRFKNKLKAKFRQHGVQCTGYSLYGSGRDEWWGRLPAGGRPRAGADAMGEHRSLQRAKEPTAPTDRQARLKLSRDRCFSARPRYRPDPGCYFLRHH